jgi:4a-hydroxytetrahydrobiopterin dehydratase
MGKLSGTEVAQKIRELPDWRENQSVISRTFQFKDFGGAMKFVNAIAVEAEKANHHPDIDIRWNKVTLAFSTHDAGGLTEKDFSGAKIADRLAGEHGSARS